MTEKFARLYIEHIRLQLLFRPPKLELRTFMDNWFAYKVGGPFLNSKQKPKWFNKPDPTKEAVALRSMHFISDEARACIGNNSKDEVHLVKDHSVPVKIIEKILMAKPNPTVDFIEDELKKNYRLGIITKSEDEDLNKAGLRRRMPVEAQADSVFARYEYAKSDRARLIPGEINQSAIDQLIS